MFLKELYSFSRPLFISFLLFIFLFLYINVKWGVVAFPINVYGMYSGKLYVNDTQQVYHIYADNSLVKFSELSMSERDMLQYSLDFYKTEKVNNAVVYTTMRRLLDKIYIGKLMREEEYINHADTIMFSKWFKSKLNGIIHKQIKRYDIYTGNYQWQNGMLKPVSEPVKFLSIESYH